MSDSTIPEVPVQTEKRSGNENNGKNFGTKVKTIIRKVTTPMFLHARNYDTFVDPEVYDEYITGHGREYLAQAVGDLIEKNLLQPVDGKPQILDIAAGTGIIARNLEKRGWNVVATDLGENALQYLKEESPQEIDVVKADMNQGFPFQDNSFDGATTVAANRFITDSNHFLEEVHRVLKPGGVFIWPLGFRDSIRWKLFSRFKTPTFPGELVKLAKEKGFSEVKLASAQFPQSDRYPRLFPGQLQYIVAEK